MKNLYVHNNFLKLKISAIMKDPTLNFSLPILDISEEGRVSQLFYLGPSFYFMEC